MFFRTIFLIFFRNWARKIFRRWVLICLHTANWRKSFRTAKTVMTSWRGTWSFRICTWQNALKKNSRKALSEWWKDFSQAWKMNWWIFERLNIKEFKRQKKSLLICFISSSRMPRCLAVWMRSGIIVWMNMRHYLDVTLAKRNFWSYRISLTRCMWQKISIRYMDGFWKNAGIRHFRMSNTKSASWNTKMYFRCYIWSTVWPEKLCITTSSIWSLMKCRIILICSMWSWIRSSNAGWQSSAIRPRHWMNRCEMYYSSFRECSIRRSIRL